jgi:YcfA-like protein.
MNRKKLERHLVAFGCRFHHRGGEHDIWWNAGESASVPVPRHKEIATYTMKSICKKLGIPPPPEK